MGAITAATALAIVAGGAIAASGSKAYITTAIGAGAVVMGIAAWRLRARQVALWVLILVGVLNFTPALFTPQNLADEPLWQKAVKDGPLLLIFLAALPLATRPIVDSYSRRLRDWFCVVLALLASAMVLDVVSRGTDALAWLVSLRYYVLYPLLFLVMWRLDIREREGLRFAQGIVLIGALECLLAGVNFLGLVGQSFYQDYVTLGGSSFARATGTLGNPDNFGLFLGLPVFLLLSRTVFPRWASRLLLALLLLGMALTFSRTVAVALALAVILQGAVRAGTLGWLRATVLVMASGVLGYLAVTCRTTGRPTAETLLGTRVETIPEAFSEWISDPVTLLVGQGYGSLAVGPGGGGRVIDNMPLYLALEGGVVALLLVGLLIAIVMRLLTRAAGNALTRAVLGYGIFFLAFLPVTVNLRLFPGALLFWIFAGIATNGVLGGREARSGAPQRGSGRPIPAPEPVMR